MKIIPIIILSAFTTLLYGKIKNPYLTLKFDKVVMYDFSGGKDWNQYIVNEKGKLATSITKQVVIDQESVTKLNIRLGLKSSYGGGEAACFDPHLGFVYYCRGKIVAFITICLECNVLVSSIRIIAQEQGKVGLGKDAYYMAGGPSQSLRLFLNDLLKKYKFSHEIRGGI